MARIRLMAAGAAALLVFAGAAVAAGDGGGNTLPPPPRGEIFDDAAQGLIPLSPEEIRQFRTLVDESQRASMRPATPVPTAKARSVEISLDPGVAPPTINLRPGFATAISVFDITGKPWPVLRAVNGNTQGFDIQPPLENQHFLYAIPKQAYATGNVLLFLEDQAVPVVLNVAANTEALESRIDVRVSALGPQSDAPIVGTDLPVSGDPVLTGMIDGVAPPGAVPVRLAGEVPGQTRAWRHGGRLYLRTTAQVLSPPWSAQVGGAGDLRVYDLPDIPVVWISVNGRQVPVTVN